MNQKTLTTKYNLEGIKNFQKALKLLESGDIIMDAAIDLQRKAFQVMKDRYFSTKSSRIQYYHKRVNKNKKYRIEDRLFNSIPKPKLLKNNMVEIKLINNFDKIVKDVPHLLWQEQGTKGMVDSQPYRVGFRRDFKGLALKPITKRRAKNRRRVTGNWFLGGVVYLDVPHPPLRAREFILSGNNYLKRHGLRIMSSYINRILRRENNG